jgi:heat shock protein HslJ
VRPAVFVPVLAFAAATCPAWATPQLEGVTWVAEDIDGRGVIDNLQSTLLLEHGRAAGNAGCNRYTGQAEAGAGTLRFGAMAATRMMCPPAVMDQESRFLQALEGFTSYGFAGSLLELRNAAGQVVLKFSASR